MFKSVFAALTLALLATVAHATSLQEVQQQWAEANYNMSGKEQIEALTALAKVTETAEAASPTQAAEFLIWDGIVKSTLAGKKGGLSALSLVKAARKSLEKAIELEPDALEGSAFTSLGALYYQVPGWPVAFGDDDKAGDLLEKALSLNPDGIDSNFFYADYLYKQGDYAGARQALERAVNAPARPDRPLADAGRHEEIKALMAKIPS